MSALTLANGEEVAEPPPLPMMPVLVTPPPVSSISSRQTRPGAVAPNHNAQLAEAPAPPKPPTIAELLTPIAVPSKHESFDASSRISSSVPTASFLGNVHLGEQSPTPASQKAAQTPPPPKENFYTVPMSELMYVGESDDTTDSIEWEEQVAPGGKTVTVVKCANLAKLIERVTYHSVYDNNYLYAFLLTYRSFTTPEVLLDKLMERFNIAPPEGAEFFTFKETMLDPIRLRVCQVIRYWIEKHFYDFENDKERISKLEAFIDVIEKSRMESTAKQLRKILEKMKNEENSDEKNLFFSQPPPKPLPLKSKKGKTSSVVEILDWPSLEIARQMTIVEYELFRRIQPKECLNQAWNQANRAQKAPGISAMINRFNEVSLWCSAVIVKQDNFKKRVKVLKKIIKLAYRFKELHNFNGIFEVFAGLTSNSVYRLRKTWDALPQKTKNTYRELDALISRDLNYKTIREEVNLVSPPLIPYIGLYLSDLTFIEDGNPKEINSKINFIKCRKLAQLIRSLQTYQQTPYRLQIVTELREPLLALENLSEEELYKLSLLREERKKKAASGSGGGVSSPTVLAPRVRVSSGTHQRVEINTSETNDSPKSDKVEHFAV